MKKTTLRPVGPHKQGKKTDFDSPWKDILEKYFPEFMQFFFPNVFSEINWKKRPVFLDKELQKVVRGASF
ncbi:MAG: hypothetical protein WA705_03015, partial [Candidatus Ozemobacteraceae bacterium]